MIRSIVDDRMLTIYLLISEDFFLLFKSDQFEMMAKLTKSKSKDDRIVVPCFWSLTSACLEFQVFVFSVNLCILGPRRLQQVHMCKNY